MRNVVLGHNRIFLRYKYSIPSHNWGYYIHDHVTDTDTQTADENEFSMITKEVHVMLSTTNSYNLLDVSIYYSDN